MKDYFERIGYSGSPKPDLRTLGAIVLGHVEYIPFENLDVLMGRPIRLDLPSLREKLLFNRRGGYCFEQNGLLKAVLESIGFQVTGLGARVLWDAAPEAVTPRTHMLLRVDIEGVPWIVDAGVGAMTPTGVLRLDIETPQQTPHERYRLTRSAGSYLLEGDGGDEWKPLYRFNLEPWHGVDYEVSNWYVSTHPQSHFRHSLAVARAVPNRRYTLRDTQLTIRDMDGGTERHTLESAAEIRSVLEDIFRLQVPNAPELDRAFERISSCDEAAQKKRTACGPLPPLAAAAND